MLQKSIFNSIMTKYHILSTIQICRIVFVNLIFIFHFSWNHAHPLSPVIFCYRTQAFFWTFNNCLGWLHNILVARFEYLPPYQIACFSLTLSHTEIRVLQERCAEHCIFILNIWYNDSKVWPVIEFIAQHLCHKFHGFVLVFTFHLVFEREIRHSHLIMKIHWAI